MGVLRFVFFYFYELRHVSGGSGVAIWGQVRQLVPWGGGVERSGSGAAHPSEFPKN
nr:MAG TPA: hypothetical protein [Bacteriophage sp.]